VPEIALLLDRYSHPKEEEEEEAESHVLTESKFD
jgi:hypothetical protein